MQGIGKLDLVRRIQRLDELSRGLAAEVQRWRRGTDPLTLVERRQYLNAIQDAIAAAEDARLTVARVLERLGKEERALREKRRRQGVPNAPA
jgi:hypothetical protein